MGQNLQLYLPLLAIRLLSLPYTYLPVALTVSALAWTFIEYFYHRFLLHREDELPADATPADIEQDFTRHAVHHAFPNYATMLVLHPFDTVLVLAVASFFGLLYGLLGLGVDLTCGRS